MENLRSKVITAVSQMDDAEIELVWNFISHAQHTIWEDIPAVEPDEWDLQMLEEIKTDPECHEYVSSEEAKRILGI